MADNQEKDHNIEIWKMKKLIEASRGNGTSMISVIIPPRDQLPRVAKMLVEEYGTASNIKSRVNCQSVLGAITSALQRLKFYSKVPPNGLVLYKEKEKKVTFDFEPMRRINASLYLCDNKFHTEALSQVLESDVKFLCDNKFHTEALSQVLESDVKFGFIVMDGNETLFGTLSGDTRDVLRKFSVDLPNRHGRGGQSALRFSRLGMEKRHNYVRKTSPLSVSGLILAGSAELSQSNVLDPRLQAKIVKVVDVWRGGGVIQLSVDVLSNVRFIQEIRQDSGEYVFGVDDTLNALETGAVQILILWESLKLTLRNNTTGEVIVKHLHKSEEATAAEWEVEEEVSLPASEYRISQAGGLEGCFVNMRAFDDLSGDDDSD